MIRFQALWKTKSFVKVCLKFKLPLWTKGLLIHLSPLWQLPLWHFPRWHNFPVYEHIQNESRKFYCTFIVMNILAFKVKKNEINISSFDHFTDIFLSMHVELITYPIYMQMSSKSIVLHMQNTADSTDINFKHFSFKK